ncbi:MFS transporter [Siccirubricoccus deserti]|uniref:Tripartite tricarboxylate transporter substrate binding protein n=1 Tax=Siccirubricoccus deserti TaxID=2013562 RepID=A0A9X0QW06_9PROT|nr:tripartite tricarboxylate transporter substrate binding protein [Siccirubricoccus deserti]MBC4014986.1 tripartite tricarboxylate transporter substrate binding protein [Siccirubricoccus deserti]GGC36487.1 MFS transporter [Siccirubricoccus deserti]
MAHQYPGRRGLLALAAVPALAAPRLARAQQDQGRPLTMVVPYPPGGTSDLAIRPLVPRLSELLGQTVVIENRAGAGGSIGAEVVARARPDGLTLLAFPTAVLTISPHIMSLSYDPATAFTPISMSAVAYGIVVAHPSLPFRDVAGLVAHAKAHPGELRFGSAGNGTITQLSGEMFAEAAGIRLEHVPYRGSAPSLTDLLAGRIQLLFDPVAIPAIVEGRLTGIATIGETRNPQLPDVPTLREAGLAKAEAMPWFGIAAPAGIARPVVDRLTGALQTALAAPEAARAMAPMGLMPRFEAGEAFASRIHREREMYGAVVRRIGARAG